MHCIRVIAGLVCLLFVVASHAQYRTSGTTVLYDPTKMTYHVGLTGRVLLPDGKPAVGALVELTNGWSAETSTTVDAHGDFALNYPNTMGGHYEVRISLPGWSTVTYDLPMGNQLPPVTLQLAAPIRGKAISAAGAPLENINVALSAVLFRDGKPIVHKRDAPFPTHEQRTTDHSGSFAFDDVTSGEYVLKVYGEGFVGQQRNVVAPSADLMFTLFSGSCSLHGVTILHDTGQPVPGTTVTIFASTASTTVSDSNGRYQFTKLEPGGWEVHARTAILRNLPGSNGSSNPFDTFVIFLADVVRLSATFLFMPATGSRV